MTKKTRYVGRESGKSSTKYFTPGDPPGTEAAKHGRGARAGDGETTDHTRAGKIEVTFRTPPGRKS